MHPGLWTDRGTTVWIPGGRRHRPSGVDPSHSRHRRRQFLSL